MYVVRTVSELLSKVKESWDCLRARRNNRKENGKLCLKSLTSLS